MSKRSNSPVLNGKLSLWEENSLPPVSSWNLSFRDDPSLNVRYLWIFHVIDTFYKLDVNILVIVTKLGSCVSLGDHLLIAFALAKEAPGTSLRSNAACSFVELNRLLLKFVLLCQGIFRKVLTKTLRNSIS